MHILLSILGALATILMLLDKMGVDLGGLNPFSWRRRRQWNKKYHANPAFIIDNPMEATALLLCVVAKADGDMTSDEKQALQSIFQRTFKLSEREAAELLSSSIYLLGKDNEVINNPTGVLENCIDKFTDEQKQSAVELFEEIANVGPAATEAQVDCIQKLKLALLPNTQPPQQWH